MIIEIYTGSLLSVLIIIPMGTGHPTAVIHHNIHHILIRPITNIGTSSFVAVTFITYQPRRVYCRPEAVAFVTLSPTSGL